MMQQGYEYGSGPGYGYGYPPVTPPMRQEIPLLAEQGIQVTSARFVVYQQTYPLNGITHVAPFSFQPSRTGALLGGMLFGLLTCICGGSAMSGDGSIGPAFFFALLTAACVWSFVSKKMVHGVVVSTAGMQQRPLMTTDAGLVHRVVGALNHAISMR